jgi:hypothetical protein
VPESHGIVVSNEATEPGPDDFLVSKAWSLHYVESDHSNEYCTDNSHKFNGTPNKVHKCLKCTLGCVCARRGNNHQSVTTTSM